MRLREFDIVYAGEKVKGKSDRAEISSQTRSTSSLFERCFSKTKFVTQKQWKISIDAVDTVKRDDVQDLLGVLVVEVPFDLDRFKNSSTIGKKQMSLEILYEGIRKVCADNHWPLTPFKRAYDCVVSVGYSNEWTWGKPKWNPSRTLSAEVHCIHDVTRFEMQLLIRNRAKQEISRIKLREEFPREFVFLKHLGRLDWISEKEVGVISKHSKSHWLINVDEHRTDSATSR